MLNLLNAVNMNDPVLWLLVVLSFLSIIEIFAILIVVRNSNKNVERRRLVGITLDADVVRREYVVGEKFDPSGLIIRALYSVQPFEITIQKFTVVTPELIGNLAREGKKPEDLGGCLVFAPDLCTAGKPVVTVTYKDQNAVFAISVVKPAAKRTLIGLKLNTDTVRKTFTTGETFEREGLVVFGLYNLEPCMERISDFKVLPPDMSKAGKPFVTVNYLDQSVDYMVTVADAEPEVMPEPEAELEIIQVKREPVIIEEESSEGGALRYDRSFTARLIQSDDELKQWYTELKNYLLSFKKVKDRMSWKRESYRYGRDPVVRLGFRGKTLCAYLPFDPNDFSESKFKVEDVSDNVSYADTPCMYRIKNARRVKYLMELIDTVMERLNGGARVERDSVDYYMPYEGIVELIQKGLIKRNVKSEDELIYVAKARTAEVAASEEPTGKPIEK